MMQIVEQTHEEKVKMYKKLKKRELIEMLIALNESMIPHIWGTRYWPSVGSPHDSPPWTP